MQIKCHKPGEKDIGQIARDFYLDNERINGRNPLRKLSLRCCEKGFLDSYPLFALDKNYNDTSIQVEEVYGNYLRLFIGLYADNDHLVAHTSLSCVTDEFGNEIVQISEIHIDNKDKITGEASNGEFSFIYGIYREMISFIEELVAERFPNTDRIDLISFAQDGDFWCVTDAQGYDLSDSGDLPGYKMRFTKLTRERGMKYERSITSKQD